MQVVPEIANESSFRARTRQKESVGGEGIEEPKEPEAVDEIPDKAVYRDQAFGLEFAQWDMNSPLIGSCHAEAIPGQVGAFADPHAGVANQQKGVAAQIVTAEEFLPQELILLCGERTREPLRQAWDILASDQMREIRELFVPSQFGKDAPQRNQQIDVRRCPERWSLCAEPGHPAEHVRTAAQLLKRDDVGVISTEVAQKIAGRSAVMAGGFGIERSGKRLDGSVEHRDEAMLQRRTPRQFHDEAAGTGRMCCATARVYSTYTSCAVTCTYRNVV